MKTVFVTPKPGLQVPDEKTGRAIPESGAEVTASEYWLRRERDGDVTVSQPPAASPAKPKGKPQ